MEGIKRSISGKVARLDQQNESKLQRRVLVVATFRPGTRRTLQTLVTKPPLSVIVRFVCDICIEGNGNSWGKYIAKHGEGTAWNAIAGSI
eukprot:1162955-Amphidinium_carterae.1